MGLSLTQGNFVSDERMAVKLNKKLKNNDIKFFKVPTKIRARSLGNAVGAGVIRNYWV